MIQPFANGSQFSDWCGANCDRCTKATKDCDLLLALDTAYFTDGMISDEIAKRIGAVLSDGQRNRCYCWECPEVDWTQAWLDTWSQRLGFRDYNDWKANHGEAS